MGKEWKAIEELRKEMKELKDSLGLGNQAGKNIQMLLTTIQAQGNEEHEFKRKAQEQAKMLMTQLNMREEFLAEKNLKEEYEAWYNSKIQEMKDQHAAKIAEAKIAAASKLPEDPALQEKPSEFKPGERINQNEVTGPLVPKPEEIPGKPVNKDAGGRIERKEINMDSNEDKERKKQLVTEDKMRDAKEAVDNAKKTVVNDQD